MSDLYNASEARAKLGGIAPEILKRYVDNKKIRKVVPPENKRKGFYVKEDVDKLAEAMREFSLIHALVPKNEIYEFSQARGEKDIKATVQIAKQHFGERAYGLEKRMGWYKINPRGDYVLKHNGVIVAYFSVQVVKKEVLENMFNPKKGRSLQIEDTLPFMPNTSCECYISAIATKIEKDREMEKRYGRLLILGILTEVLPALAKEKIDIEKIWAMSGSVTGIKLSRDLGFTELDYINNEQIGFLIDTRRSTYPLIQKYREELEKAKIPELK